MDSKNFHETGARRPRDLLKSYYGITDGSHGSSQQKNTKEQNDEGKPCDINGPNFDPDVYLNKLLKERTLTELVDKEQEMVRNIRTLDSDMQTLVYENYNKFISATDTIRKMKTDFKRMEEEMNSLSGKMSDITEFSGRISATLQDRRQQITKLSGVHTLLMKLQFLFDLPNKLQKCLEQEKYAQAVRYHTKARKVLQQYQDMPSFHGIREDCSVIVGNLTDRLREQFRKKNSNPKQLTECVELLLQLNEPAEVLCEEFLSHAREKIDADLATLELQLKLCESSNNPATPASEGSGQTDNGLFNVMDVLEFVDCGCNCFLSNVCLVVASYSDMFLNRHQEDIQLDAIALKRLVQFVNELMTKYFEFVQRRVQMEKNTGDNTILVRALDRFHRRLQAMNKLLPDSDFSRAGTELVARSARERVNHYLESLQLHLSDCLTDIRQSIASFNRSGISAAGAPPRGGVMGYHGDGSLNLGNMVRRLQASVVEQVKSALANLQAFIDPDVTFATKHYFRSSFCSTDVRENLVVAFIRHIIKTSLDFIEQTEEKSSVPSCLLLVTSRLCLDLEQSSVAHLLNVVEEQFRSEDRTELTPASLLTSEARSAAQLLLNHYVKVQGSVISQMLRKSVETRDCLSTIEPRTVRAVMKRVIEDVTSVDRVVGQLFEEGSKTERLSDSTARRSLAARLLASGGGGGATSVGGGAKSQWSYTPSTMDTSLMSNIQKLFYEKIEIFSPVDFTKVSVMTGVIKISLKTLLECVRLKTFGRYGLQQIQVDCHYLQLYLWRFVHDENLVHMLLDEIVSSTIHRCLDPVPMEGSVVDLICERG